MQEREQAGREFFCSCNRDSVLPVLRNAVTKAIDCDGERRQDNKKGGMGGFKIVQSESMIIQTGMN